MRLAAVLFEPELRAWRGQMALWKVYWGYGVFASVLLALLLIEAMREHRPWLQQGALIALALYTFWILVAVWRCAANASAHWRFLARLSTIVWACNAILLLGFLELELIARLLAREG